MRALVALALASTALVPSRAGALPPYAVTGTGYVAPGLSITAAESSFWFTGTATDVLGVTSSCTFHGYVSGNVSGAAGGASGTCAGVHYPTCATTMSTTQWTITCTPPGTGSFVVTPYSATHMTSFDATGTFT